MDGVRGHTGNKGAGMRWRVFERTDTGEREVGVIYQDGTSTGEEAEVAASILQEYQDMGFCLEEALARMMFTSSTCYVYVPETDE